MVFNCSVSQAQEKMLEKNFLEWPGTKENRSKTLSMSWRNDAIFVDHCG